ncbi:MAG: hypothetical protein HC819_13470 [Cyclobacteriaceae bacterium]|nr:hypothetical protein [Cyclobacteriaceae bacterium]
MKAGYVNFQHVDKGEILAHDNHGPVASTRNAHIFMPLYQDQGCDGFFLVQEIKDFWFQLSSRTRKWKLDKTINILPGIHKAKFARDAFLIDKNRQWNKVISLLHLLGYRKVHYSGRLLRMSRRPYDRRSPKIKKVQDNFSNYLRLLQE